jgi:hypothetical protein
MSTTYFNIVQFNPDGGAGVSLLLEEPWKCTAGIRPDFNRAIVNFEEYARLSGLGVNGTVNFYFNGNPIGGGGAPDLTLSSILLLDAEVVEYGIPSGTVTTIPVKYRLIFVDSRYAFVEPRGGRLVNGLINPSTIIAPDPARTNVPQQMTLTQLVQQCLTAMGVTATVPVFGQEPPMDLKWFGTHAPSELAKLLAMGDATFCLQPDGSYAVFELGTGTDPAIPKPLPAATLAGADGRGKTVVFTSFPTQIAAVLTQADLNSGDLTPVIQDNDGAWVGINSAGVYNGSGSTTAIEALNAHFGGSTTNVPDPNEQYGCYRFVRLNPNVFDPVISPILRKAWSTPSGGGDATPADPDGSSPDDDSGNPNSLPPLIDIDFRAKVATQNASTGLWSMPSGFVKIPVKAIHDGNIIELSHRLVNLPSGSVTTDLDGFCGVIDFDTDIQIRFAVGVAQWNGSNNTFTPAYFYTGFSGTPETVTTLDATAAQAAMNLPDTVVIPIAELEAVAFGTGDAGCFNSGTPLPIWNQTALVGRCQNLAARYLKDAAVPPRSLAGVGFFNFTFNGNISEVEIDQQQAMQRFRVDSWFRPAGSYLGREFERLRKHRESHPHEAKTAGTRSAIGASGSSQPVQRVESYMPLAQPGRGLFKVVALPTEIDAVVPTYVTAVPYSNGSSGTVQSSIGIVVPHAVGDYLMASPCSGGSEPGGTPQMDAAGNAITMMEEGSFGVGIRCPVVQYGGSNGSVGSPSTYTYSPKDPGNTVQLAIGLSVKEARSFPLPVTAANYGRVAIDNKTGTWIVLSVEEVYLVVTCPSGGD